jgi:hypothetical protein
MVGGDTFRDLTADVDSQRVYFALTDPADGSLDVYTG